MNWQESCLGAWELGLNMEGLCRQDVLGSIPSPAPVSPWN